jgi:hypothetical protein
MSWAQWSASLIALGMILGWALTLTISDWVNPRRGRHRDRY